MRNLLLITFSLVLMGCTNGYKEQTFPVRPKELADCRFFKLDNDNGESITVVRCPNSTTTTAYRSGKTTRNAVVIDGVEYVEKEQSNVQ